MRFNPNIFGISLGITFVVLYAASTLFIVLAPEYAIKILNIFYISGLSQIIEHMNITLIGFILGLIQVFILMYIVGALFAYVYNSLIR